MYVYIFVFFLCFFFVLAFSKWSGNRSFLRSFGVRLGKIVYKSKKKKIIKNSRKKMLNQKGNLIEKPVTSISKADGIHRETSLC